MKKYLRHIFWFCSPVIVLLLAYMIDDPFRMYWPGEDLYDPDARKQCVNDAYRGIRWMNQYNDAMHYNSFIIGSSRSDFYYVDDWKQYIGENAGCFHFDQSGDNLLGGLQRVRYLYNRINRIDNMLLIMDIEYLADMTPRKGHLFRQPWQVTKEWDFFAYNWECIRAFYTKEYQRKFWGIDKEEKILPYYYIPEYNELHKNEVEELLDTNPEAYYATLEGPYQLYERHYTDSVADPVIESKQRAALEELHSLLINGKTDYRIVISPLYNQIKLNPQDYKILVDIFGEGRVFDFSGVNEFTEDTTNYYEISHYRPRVCQQIMRIIYQNQR